MLSERLKGLWCVCSAEMALMEHVSSDLAEAALAAIWLGGLLGNR